MHVYGLCLPDGLERVDISLVEWRKPEVRVKPFLRGRDEPVAQLVQYVLEAVGLDLHQGLFCPGHADNSFSGQPFGRSSERYDLVAQSLSIGVSGAISIRSYS